MIEIKIWRSDEKNTRGGTIYEINESQQTVAFLSYEVIQGEPIRVTSFSYADQSSLTEVLRAFVDPFVDCGNRAVVFLNIDHRSPVYLLTQQSDDFARVVATSLPVDITFLGVKGLYEPLVQLTRDGLIHIEAIHLECVDSSGSDIPPEVQMDFVGYTL